MLRVFSNDDVSEEASPLEIRHVNVDLLQRKITDLQRDNRKLHEEATEVGKSKDKRRKNCRLAILNAKLQINVL